MNDLITWIFAAVSVFLIAFCTFIYKDNLKIKSDYHEIIKSYSVLRDVCVTLKKTVQEVPTKDQLRAVNDQYQQELWTMKDVLDQKFVVIDNKFKFQSEILFDHNVYDGVEVYQKKRRPGQKGKISLLPTN